MPEDDPDTEVSLGECCRMYSKCGRQGNIRYDWKGGCKSDKCSYCKVERCTSKYHYSVSFSKRINLLLAENCEILILQNNESEK